MRQIALATTLFASIASGTHAFAADTVVETVAPYDWSGVYVGLQAGGTWIKADDGVDSLTLNGGTFGAYAGANWQSGNIVLGVEGEVSYSSADGEIYGVEYGADWNAALRARVGYAFDNLLVYGAAGLVVSKAYVDMSPLLALDETLTGWTIGGGAEYAFTQNWIARLDYRYTDYRGTDFGINDTIWGPVDDLHQSENTVRVGVAYKF